MEEEMEEGIYGVQELTPEEVQATISELKAFFEQFQEKLKRELNAKVYCYFDETGRHVYHLEGDGRWKSETDPGFNWNEVEAKLLLNPKKVPTLKKLIDRGGLPTVTAKLEDGRFRFDELSPESPVEDRNVTRKQAEALAREMGAELMSEDVYRWLFLHKRQALDNRSKSFLKGTSASNGVLGQAGAVLPHDPYHQDADTGIRYSVVI